LSIGPSEDGDALEAREKRLTELKFLFSNEDDPHAKKLVWQQIKDIVNDALPALIVIQDSDDEITVIKSKVPPSADAKKVGLLRFGVTTPNQKPATRHSSRRAKTP
jgi:hypothetical protein